ncbi:vomeronasal type-2 receptor 26-like [Mixophyes fleayi]|uniref:vomeronasal type-2 receptor 26-like n=1 Tax=Mixophyes fleayi TaxID=3061075 RepID=UPI003F4DB89D
MAPDTAIVAQQEDTQLACTADRHMTITIEGKCVKAVLDSGSMVTLEKAELVSLLKHQWESTGVTCIHGDTRYYATAEVNMETQVQRREYRHVRAFIFAINQINKDPNVLPNITLGYHLYDSCGSESKAVEDVLQILSGHRQLIPNYKCIEHGKVVGFIGDLNSFTTIPMAQLLNVYGYAQISYGARDPVLNDRTIYPHFFRTLYNDQMQYLGTVKLLKLFGWNWVGIISSDDDSGERELQQLSRQLTTHGICIEFKFHMPQGQCSDKCLDGFRKAPRGGSHACCYDCVSCSEGEISSKSDNENCVKCIDNEWPNDAKDKCIAKVQEFFSYETDPIASVFSVMAVLFSVITVFITGIFISFLNSQIVRANNRNLSFILLLSLKLSFLCIFLFLGRPVHITCMLRQIFFGIIFTVAVSSILAKTIMVCIAFKATSPGSYWRKWIGVKLPNCLVLICSSVQVLNGIIWLSVSPPFQEFNMNTYPGKIIIQCNEGSVLAFYFMLGYMGFLSAVSFFLAFMVRTLPEIFNEAKYITFSMLVFCSVWICAIPAYLSSKGKNMVIVEVFAILASCIGILGCIFFPKCYNILMRPEMNRKELLC